jgi:sugar phosphate isomerase/epimerase
MSGKLSARLGIQSFCFRSMKTHEQLIGALLECGVNHFELCGIHFDPQKSGDAKAVVEQYKRSGIALSAFGVNGFTADEAAARKVFEFAAAAGFPTISADFQPSALPVVEKLCGEYQKKVAVHNHGRKHRYGPVWALESLFNNSSPNIGLCLDTAWMLDSGGDPLAVAEKFRDRLYGVHLKDFTFDRAGKHQDVIVGTGNLNLPAFAAFLVKTNFDGYLTLEYEGDKDHPVPSVKKCVESVRAAFAQVE